MNGSHLAIANAIQTSLANDFHEIQGVILSKVWNQLLEKKSPVRALSFSVTKP